MSRTSEREGTMDDEMHPIQPLPHDQGARLSLARQYAEECSIVCSCRISAKFHLDKERARRLLEARVESRSSEILVAVGDHRLYTGNRSIEYREFAAVVSDLEWARGVLQQIAPSHEPDRPLDDQGAVGRAVRILLSNTIRTLDGLKLVPDYWANVRFNATAIMFSVREVLRKRARVVEFLQAVDNLSKGDTSRTVAELRDCLEDDTRAVKSRIDTLQAADVELAQLLDRMSVASAGLRR